jgi:hypothetical protein
MINAGDARTFEMFIPGAHSIEMFFTPAIRFASGIIASIKTSVIGLLILGKKLVFIM